MNIYDDVFVLATVCNRQNCTYSRDALMQPLLGVSQKGCPKSISLYFMFYLGETDSGALPKTISRYINRNPCNRPLNCRYCRKINKKEQISSSDKKREFNPLTNVNCQSSNLIYLITCKHCGIHYVGQTKNRLLTRFQGHYHDIKTKNDTTVSRHFNKCPSGKPSFFDGIRISILSFMHHPSDTTSSQRERDREEKRWMQRLSSIVPKGVNLMD